MKCDIFCRVSAYSISGMYFTVCLKLFVFSRHVKYMVEEKMTKHRTVDKGKTFFSVLFLRVSNFRRI